MGYYMRFIMTDGSETTLAGIEQGLRQIDTAYSVGSSGELHHGTDLYAQIDINRLGDEMFDDEIAELKEFVEDVRGKRKKDVLKVLDEAKTILAVQVLWEDRDADATLDRLSPLWDWLFSNRTGLLRADGEGYYDTSGLILGVE